MGRPPSTSTRLSWRSAKNPMERPSGDQNGCAPPSVPGMARTSWEPRSRNQILQVDSVPARPTNTRRAPSGESVAECAIIPSGRPSSDTVRRGVADAGDRSSHQVPPTAPRASTATPTARRRQSGNGPAWTDASDRGTISSGAPASTSSSTTRASPIACRRSRGLLRRHRRSSRTTGAGVSPGRAPQSGSSLRTLASTCEVVSPTNRRRPASIS
jgi:hypothetical protein